MTNNINPQQGPTPEAGGVTPADSNPRNPLDHLGDRFFSHLLAANRSQLAGFRHWQLHPGMLFQATQQWWGKLKPRPTPHEGLDLCWFEDLAGQQRSLDQTTLIPAPFAGRVIQISRDFLGESIFLVHEQALADGRLLLAAFGHTLPQANLRAGCQVGEGEILAAIAPPGRRRSTVPPHLHMTVAVLVENYRLADLAWERIGSSARVQLLDPLVVCPTTYQVLAGSRG